MFLKISSSRHCAALSALSVDDSGERGHRNNSLAGEGEVNVLRGAGLMSHFPVLEQVSLDSIARTLNIYIMECKLTFEATRQLKETCLLSTAARPCRPGSYRYT